MSYEDDIKVYKQEKAYYKMCKSCYGLFRYRSEMFIFTCKSFLGIRISLVSQARLALYKAIKKDLKNN